MTQPEADPTRAWRVLHAPPTARDGQITTALLAREKMTCWICRDFAQLAEEIGGGAGAILLTDEALASREFDRVIAALASQPAWSDLPIVMLLRTGAEAALERSGLRGLHNLTILARPAPARSVVSAVAVALRARERQYQIRDQIEEIRQAEARLEEAARMKDEFLATLSHELRTPLNAILGWSSLTRRSSAPDVLEQGLAAIERNARVQVQLIDDLLDMSRITSGKLHLHLAPLDPISFVQAAVDTIAPAARAKGLELRSVSRRGVGLVNGDADRLQQVVWNLLSNAVKFGTSPGAIDVSIDGDGERVTIAVADTGPGIDPAFLPFVFDRFRQADASMTRMHRGLGLGLAIVRHLVEAHGGSVAAANRPDRRGALFTVTLPVAVDLAGSRASRDELPVAGADAPEAEADGQPLQGVTVLFVDDEPDARVLGQTILEESGARVRVAASADEALTWLSTTTPDVIVSDLGMPGKDGYALLREVRAKAAARIPAIALSAFARPVDRERALRSGYAIHLSKPVEPRDLVAAVERVAPGRRTRQPGRQPAGDQRD